MPNPRRKLNTPSPEMQRALEIHALAWWQRRAEEERGAHERERQADYKQPYRIKPCSKGEWEPSYVARNRKKLIRIWQERGLDVKKMLQMYGLS